MIVPPFGQLPTGVSVDCAGGLMKLGSCKKPRFWAKNGGQPRFWAKNEGGKGGHFFF